MLSSRQQGRSETEEYSSDSESESEDEEELQMILEDLQKQNEELEVSVRHFLLVSTARRDPKVRGSTRYRVRTHDLEWLSEEESHSSSSSSSPQVTMFI